MPVVTALYAGLLGILALAVAFPAGMMRGRRNIPVGDGGDREMLLAMRRHGNFAEWVPLALILLALLEMNIALKWPIHLLGAALVVFRIVHALTLRADTVGNAGRAVGAMGTALVVATSSLWLLFSFFARLA